MTGRSPTGSLGALGTAGFVQLAGPFGRPDDAWTAARAIIDTVAVAEALVEVVGDYVVPPVEGPPSRAFQTLHLDFGLPLAPAAPDVARFTALHIAMDTPASDAVTRLVPLRSLLAGYPLPGPPELIQRFADYGTTHGAWNDADGYSEGSLARIVEAALGQTPTLPSVKAQAGFLCGAEFGTLAAELDFFAKRGLDLTAIQTEVCLGPGELLVFDNLALAHGRRGTRQPGELNQRVFGHRALSASAQLELRDCVLTALRS